MSFLQAHLRSLCFYDAIKYPPTVSELVLSADHGLDERQATDTMDDHQVIVHRGRVVLPGSESLIDEHEKRERLFARKIRRARRVVRWLARLGGIRFVALCNTTAMAHADEEGDLDFFIVVRRGSLWQTRGWAALPFKLLGLRPTNHFVRDAVCLSFFVDETALDLSTLALPGDDVYLRHWFLSLLPLYDDGVGQTLWKVNTSLRSRHPHARPWVLHPEMRIERPVMRLPFFATLERRAQSLQKARLGPEIREGMNRDTNVVVSDHVLKFHVQDGRKAIRTEYESRCQHYGLAP